MRDCTVHAVTYSSIIHSHTRHVFVSSCQQEALSGASALQRPPVPTQRHAVSANHLKRCLMGPFQFFNLCAAAVLQLRHLVAIVAPHVLQLLLQRRHLGSLLLQLTAGSAQDAFLSRCRQHMCCDVRTERLFLHAIVVMVCRRLAGDLGTAGCMLPCHAPVWLEFQPHHCHQVSLPASPPSGPLVYVPARGHAHTTHLCNAMTAAWGCRAAGCMASTS